MSLSLDFSSPTDVVTFAFARDAWFARAVEASRPVKHVAAPFTGEISAGKNTYVYDAHTYHTKVPPQGIRPLIEHYTSPGDVVLDPFCGSGMTGVAASLAGRKALLSDLSPAAAFIAWNLNTPVDAGRYLNAVETLIEQSLAVQHELYDTRIRGGSECVPMLYTVWSFGMLCGGCGQEFVLWDVARDEKPRVRESKIKSEIVCPHCSLLQAKRGLKRTRRYPVQIGYPARGMRENTAAPDADDLARLAAIEATGIPGGLWVPESLLPKGVNTRQPELAGIRCLADCYTPRALRAMAHLWNAAENYPDVGMRDKLKFTLTSLYQRVTVFSEFRFWGGSGNIANYNVPAIMNEQNVFVAFLRKAKTIALYFGESAGQMRTPVRVSVQSACDLSNLPDRSVDYVFTDPPFGSNINYSEMNWLWESWLGVRTDTQDEAIINKVQGKDAQAYEDLLTQAFAESHRVMKDGAWMSVVFHNSSEKVWRAVQQAITRAGLVIEACQTFDKQHGTFKMFVSDNAVGYDLVLHCRKAFDSVSAGVPLIERGDVSGFIQRALARGDYTSHFLHVQRDDEFNVRKLYSEWLAACLPRQEQTMDFEAFRRVAEQVRAGAPT
jgi:16S rRNA G966 N2-methylase RsmD/DNA-directed RNA polymerase subunit RPC12/RpoP